MSTTKEATLSTTGQLRSYIAPSAPATRTPCDGSESDLRVEYGFTPLWYRENCDVDFSERWHLDPVYRGETLVRMRQELNRRFPALQLGGANPESAPSTLDGVHGALTISRIFGVGAEYYPDNWPAARHEYLMEAQIRTLEVPDLSSNPVFVQIMEQADLIERHFGRIEGYINWQGVLNNAFRIRGDQIFIDLMMDPGLACHLFEVVTQTMISGMKLLYARQRETGVIVRHATVSNCVVNMVSPDQYREFILPYDRMLDETRRAAVVITHAGVGSVLTALQAGRLPVVVPRRAVEGEIADDHQLEVLDYLRSFGIDARDDVAELSAELFAMHGTAAP